MPANMGQRLASAWNVKIGKVNDNVFNASPLFKALGEKGFKKAVRGGNDFEFTLTIAENQTVGFYAESGQIPVEEQTLFDAATYTPKLQAGTFPLKWTDTLRTGGGEGKFDFKEESLENLKDSAFKSLNRAAYGNGTGPFVITGLDAMASANSRAYAVGNINPDAYAFWRNQSIAGTRTATAYDNLRASMRYIISAIEKGDVNDAPTHAMTGLNTRDGYESILIANERYTKSGSKAQGGNGGLDTEDLLCRQTRVVGDEDCPDADMFFINPKFLKFVYYEDAWMHMFDPVEPSNQLTQVFKIGTYGQLCTGNRRKLGRIYSIT